MQIKFMLKAIVSETFFICMRSFDKTVCFVGYIGFKSGCLN